MITEVDGKKYRACDSDTGAVLPKALTRSLIEASLAAGPEGHVGAVLLWGTDGYDTLDVAPPEQPRDCRVYVEEVAQ